jgi:hypothetical protein
MCSDFFLDFGNSVPLQQLDLSAPFLNCQIQQTGQYTPHICSKFGKASSVPWADFVRIRSWPFTRSCDQIVIEPEHSGVFTETAWSNDSILACTINARWAPVHLYLQPYIDGTVHSDNTYADDTTPLPQIQIDPS